MAPISTHRASSSLPPRRKHHVFLSFYGEDTRMRFISHLRKRLEQRGITVFNDEVTLKRGRVIAKELQNAIQESHYAVVVFSERYASSKWCLFELTTIVECKRDRGLKILPVFFHVQPSDVRDQMGSFANAFVGHERDREVDEKQMKKWKAALKEVGSIHGCNVNYKRSEAKCVEEICEGIHNGWDQNFPSIPTVRVGIESQVEEIMFQLCIGSYGVRLTGIYGMAGIGKTTLAKAIYEKVSRHFDASHFISKEEIKNSGPSMWSDGGIWGIMRISRGQKVFIVVDDVDKEERDALERSRYWLGQGSRIIVISTDFHLLDGLVDNTYRVKLLNKREALKLFSLKVLQNDAPEEPYATLFEDILNSFQGLPLAIVSVGSHLRGRSMKELETARDEMKACPDADILQTLEKSMDGLNELQKQLFLDIACFFNDMHVFNNIHKLESFGFYPAIDIRVLQERTLINVSKGRFQVHALFQTMGQQIVHRESKEPSKRSRLWDEEDIIDALKNDTGTEAIEAIVLKLPLQRKEQLCFDSFSNMIKLRMLIISNEYFEPGEDFCNLQWVGNPSKLKLSNELCVLHWWKCPLEYLPTTFQSNRLVELKMTQSNIKQLWNGKKSMESLKHIDLSYSQNLIEAPDFSEVPKLEKICLAGCSSLLKVDPSIGFLKWLRELDLRDCKRLKRFTDNISLESLEDLNLSGCLRLKKFPDVVGNMKCLRKLDLSRTAIKRLPLSFKSFLSLKSLKMSCCSKFKKIPESLSGMYFLEYLYVDGTAIRELPNSIALLKELKVLKVGGSDSNPTSLLLPNFSSSLCSLRQLDLSYRDLSSGALPRYLSCLSLLKSLDLSGSKFRMILGLFSGLSSLRKLDLSYCNLSDGAMSNLCSLSSLSSLFLRGNGFTKVPEFVSKLPKLCELYLDDCSKLKAFSKLPLGLSLLSLKNCPTPETFFTRMDMLATCEILRDYDHSFVAASIDCDGQPYKILHLHPRTPLCFRTPENFSTLVACGVARASKPPNWFNHRWTSSFGSVQKHADLDWEDDFEGWKGCALYIDYQVLESDTCQRIKKRQKVVEENGKSSSRIIDGSNPSFPYFGFQFQVNEVVQGGPLFLCVPEVPSVGQNGFWVYISAEWFGEEGNNLDGWRGLEAIITTNCRNVKLNGYGMRLVSQHVFPEFCEVLSRISIHGLSIDCWGDFFPYLHGELNTLKVEGPIKANVLL